MPPNTSPRVIDQGLRDEVYISLVRSLYADPRTLLIGSSGTVLAAFLSAGMTGHLAFYVCAAILLGLALTRAADVAQFKAAGQQMRDPGEAARWEQRYTIFSSAYVFVLGLWSFLTFALQAGAPVQLLAFSMTLANMIGVAGRNYGSRMLVATQLTCAGVPLLAGLVLAGNAHYAVVACVLAPFLLSFKSIADKLRATLTTAVVSAKRERLLAARLEAALDNMAHGLCMFGAGGRLSLVNRRLPAIVGLPAGLAEPGRGVGRFLVRCQRAGLIGRAQLRSLVLAARLALRDHTEARLTTSLADGRILELTFRTSGTTGTVVVIEDITEQRLQEDTIRQLAHYDPLTGLPNRSLLKTHLQTLMARANQSFAILFIDLDHFKKVNDTLGHPYGDTLLVEVARRLNTLLGAASLIARLGGDEFVVVIPDLTDRKQLEQITGRVSASLAQPYEVDGNAIVSGASIGIAISPDDGRDPDIVIRNADLALYAAKSSGRGCARFYDSSMIEAARARRIVELDLREALANDQFEMFYQPIVAIGSGRITSCEALLRWRHPEKGIVPPGDFIGIAEEVGLITQIGRAVLDKACREAMLWPDSVSVAVNISAIHFRGDAIVNDVIVALGRSKLPPARLVIELTESALMHDDAQALSTLTKLRDIGVRIALDDFGTGYSSLSYLQSFPLHKIKIDRSFVSGGRETQKDQTLLVGIARLCKELGLTVVAEGVETVEQLDGLAKMGAIDEVQGYLLARPQATPLVRDLIAAFAARSLTATVERMPLRRRAP
ncbi:EAL domain-containing protein [Bosea sp. 124]|uniref:putative bifunctional diguanylate cyclase/phosphodiesterase n=1 Tax=Bosea sp. 124 TaxID=2135642 RepID=UPI000D4B6632|nr:EAL domain-containing protein [Bosea sp. 124]PTM41673.1 diguanylate cyclase/phosphodiesterase [Bosea sp. 124]